MKRFILAAAVALTFPAYAQNAATVNGQPIPQSEIDTMVKAMSSRGMEDTPENRKMILDQLITGEVLSQEAVKQGLDKDEQTRLLIENSRKEILINSLIAKWMEDHNPSEADINKAYDELVADSKNTKEYNIRHILVGDEKEAQALLKRIKDKKIDFAEAAKENSIDYGSGKEGGDLGWAEADNFVPEFAEAVVAAKPNEIVAEPVKSQFGWHIIEVLGERNVEPPSKDEATPGLKQMIQQKQLQEYVEGLRESATVVESTDDAQKAEEPKKQ
ncbi:putative parvulin-type peptidyl-prolyl cis-trans isomerase [Oligella sp. MSHR50489EDL]|uniref:peptidylprolyl isomerase n=1 Tax=Oligella sp. MSHR50489EDL TaxID=3139409 RepID=UPI003D818A79